MEPLFRDLPTQGNEDTRTVLTRLGEHFINVLLTPDSIALRRLVIAQALQPDIAERFWREGPQKMFDAIEAYLADATAAGRLNVKDPKAAAKHLVALYEAEVGVRGLLGIERGFTRQQVKQIIARAVDVFLAAYGPATGR
jgi:AcrR family transcriptional regulator